jgi:hypothetical protein
LLVSYLDLAPRQSEQKVSVLDKLSCCFDHFLPAACSGYETTVSFCVPEL